MHSLLDPCCIILPQGLWRRTIRLLMHMGRLCNNYPTAHLTISSSLVVSNPVTTATPVNAFCFLGNLHQNQFALTSYHVVPSP